MGIVLKGFDTELHRPVAVKVLAPHLAHSGAARQRFAREAQSAAAVVHENVVPIHNVDTDGALPFLVMQYVAGESLQGRVERTGPLSTHETLRIGAQIASGLAAAHEQGLVHRDVKPGNILLEESVDRVLITDFGLARAADDASVTRSGVIAGTPHYMSPEQARGNSIDTRSDLFGLGSVLYFMCVGHPPFRANGAMGVLHRICNDQHRAVDEINAMVPAPLADLIDDLLAKSPSDRPPTASDVTNRLNGQLHDERSQRRFRRKGTRRSVRNFLKDHRRSLLGVAGMVGVLAICFAISRGFPLNAQTALSSCRRLLNFRQSTMHFSNGPKFQRLKLQDRRLQTFWTSRCRIRLR
jgi:serine/threonine protein kinase